MSGEQQVRRSFAMFARHCDVDDQRLARVHNSATPPWWTFPDRLLIFMVLPVAILMCASTRHLIENNRIGYSAPVFLDELYTILFLSGIILLASGAYIARRRNTAGADIRLRHGCLDFLFLACVAGYFIWYGPLLVSMPDLLIRALIGDTGAIYEIREAAPTLPGVTTLTQFGIAYACIYATAKFLHRENLHTRYNVYLVAIIALGAFRAVTNSERIAIIEIVFPLLVILCRSDRLTGSMALRAFRQTLPLLMLFGSPIFFAIFEYNRSWINHYQFEYDSYWEFVMERWGFYYVTALNNLCGFLDHNPWPALQGEFTFQWLYRLPLVGEALSDPFATEMAVRFREFLKEYAGEEFNNTTGLLTAYYDWGVAGGAIFLVAYGLICGVAFRAFIAGRGFLRYFFPVTLYSLFEILRIGYLYEGRSIAALIGLAIAFGGWRHRSGSKALPVLAR